MAGIYILDDAIPASLDSLRILHSPHCDHRAEAIPPVSPDPLPLPLPLPLPRLLGFPKLLSASPSRPWRRRYLGQQVGSRFGRRVLDAAVVDEALGATMAELAEGGGGGGASPRPSSSESRKRKRDLEEMVRWVRDVAADPCDESKVVEERERQILVARRAMFAKVEEQLADMEEFPNFSGKKQKACYLSSEEQRKKPTQVPLRRSKRIPKIVKIASTYLVKKKLGTGEQFQADIPEWRGGPSEKDISDYKKDLNTLKWLGTRVWPVDGAVIETDVAEVGKGRQGLCECPFPGSVACVRCHIRTARNQLKSELGPAFSNLGFEAMGEKVSKLLTHNEQIRFNALEQLNPASQGKTFWGVVSKHFNSKSLTDLANYHYNVYLPRRMGNQSRLAPCKVESDEDDDVEEEDDDDEPQDDADNETSVEASSSGSSLRSQNARRS